MTSLDYLGGGDVLGEALASAGQTAAVQQVRHPAQHRRQAAGIEEVLHEVGVPRRPQVGLAVGGRVIQAPLSIFHK